MLLLQSLKEKVNTIFDFYLQFQRRKFWALLGTIILIGLCVAICILIVSYLVKSAMNSNYDPMEYFLYGGNLTRYLIVLKLLFSLPYSLILWHQLTFLMCKKRRKHLYLQLDFEKSLQKKLVTISLSFL